MSAIVAAAILLAAKKVEQGREAMHAWSASHAGPESTTPAAIASLRAAGVPHMDAIDLLESMKADATTDQVEQILDVVTAARAVGMLQVSLARAMHDTAHSYGATASGDVS